MRLPLLYPWDMAVGNRHSLECGGSPPPAQASLLARVGSMERGQLAPWPMRRVRASRHAAAFALSMGHGGWQPPLLECGGSPPPAQASLLARGHQLKKENKLGDYGCWNQ